MHRLAEDFYRISMANRVDDLDISYHSASPFRNKLRLRNKENVSDV
jgi:hypothetical protein